MSQPPHLPAAPTKTSTPRPGASVPAKKDRPAPHPCSCGKHFQSKAALAQHRRDAPAHQQPASKKSGSAKSEDGGAHRGAAGGHALPRLDEAAAVVHEPGGQVAACSGKVWKKGGEVGEGGAERAISVEDRNEGAGVVARERAVLSCCGRTFKHADALRSHQRDSPKHKQTVVVAPNNQELLAALAHSPAGANYRKLKGPTLNSRLNTTKHSSVLVDAAPVRCTCGKTFKHNTALAAHQRDSPKHNKPTSGPKNRSTGMRSGRRGGGGSSSSTSSSSGLEYSYRSYGYDHANYLGGGYDWSICDKDCGWCGHCMDNVHVYY